LGEIPAVFFHFEPHAPVIEQNLGALFQRGENLGMRQRRAMRVTRRGVQIEAEFLSELQRDLALGEFAEPQFRPLQIGHHPDRPLDLLLERANAEEARLVVGALAVAEIEPEDIDAGFEQRGDLAGRAARRAQGRDDLGAALASHDWGGWIRMARKSLMLVRVGPVTTRSPSAAKAP